MRMVKEYEPATRRREVNADEYWLIRERIRVAMEKLENAALAARNEAEGDGDDQAIFEADLRSAVIYGAKFAALNALEAWWDGKPAVSPPPTGERDHD